LGSWLFDKVVLGKKSSDIIMKSQKFEALDLTFLINRFSSFLDCGYQEDLKEWIKGMEQRRLKIKGARGEFREPTGNEWGYFCN